MKTLLVVDDSPADRELIRLALEPDAPGLRLAWARDGEGALAFLRGEGLHRGAPRPDVVLLDLDLPRADGREVLRRVKRDPALQCIPIVVMTSSARESDVRSCYEMGANAYITKPIDLDAFSAVIRAFRDFWLQRAELPS